MYARETTMLQVVFDKLFAMLEAPDPNVDLASMPHANVVVASPEVW